MAPFKSTLQSAEHWSKSQAKVPKQMKSYEESSKSKKTVASMIERKGEEKNNKPSKKKLVNFATDESNVDNISKSTEKTNQNGVVNEDIMASNRLKFAQKMGGKKKSDLKKSPKAEKEKVEKKTSNLGFRRIDERYRIIRKNYR